MLIADRPEGRAGGLGLGFNGAQLLALALGGCFCNDVQYSADELGEVVEALEVTVTLELEGEPLLATGARLTAACGADPAELLARSEQRCTVANSLRAGLTVEIAKGP